MSNFIFRKTAYKNTIYCDSSSLVGNWCGTEIPKNECNMKRNQFETLYRYVIWIHRLTFIKRTEQLLIKKNFSCVSQCNQAKIYVEFDVDITGLFLCTMYTNTSTANKFLKIWNKYRFHTPILTERGDILRKAKNNNQWEYTYESSDITKFDVICSNEFCE